MRHRLPVQSHQDGLRFDKVLAELVPQVSKARLQKLVRRGQVWLDGKVVVRSNGRVTSASTIEIDLTDSSLTVLHEDDCILVIDKPAGLLTHSIPGRPDGSLSDMVDVTHGPLPTGAGKHRPGIAHRLDRGTSGVIVLARTEDSLQHLKQQFKERTVQKRYVALCLGTPPSDRWEVNRPLGPAPGEGNREWIDPPSGGKEAQTEFRTLEAFEGACWIEARPKTGRRHQIRLHLIASGLAVLDDPLYQCKPPHRGLVAEGVGRLALHASKVALIHPTSGMPLSWEAPLPDDMRRVLTRLQSED